MTDSFGTRPQRQWLATAAANGMTEAMGKDAVQEVTVLSLRVRAGDPTARERLLDLALRGLLSEKGLL